MPVCGHSAWYFRLDLASPWAPFRVEIEDFRLDPYKFRGPFNSSDRRLGDFEPPGRCFAFGPAGLEPAGGCFAFGAAGHCFALGRLKPFIGFGAMTATKPYKFIGFGAMDATKP